MAYDIGDLVRIKATFRDPEANDAYIDPATVTLKVKDPAAVTTTYTLAGGQVIKDSTGHYHYDLSVATAGLWSYRWETTGTYQAAQEATFTVNAGAF
jgi:hypothetical protein